MAADEAEPDEVIDLTQVDSETLLAQGDELLRSSRDLLDELDGVMAESSTDL